MVPLRSWEIRFYNFSWCCVSRRRLPKFNNSPCAKHNANGVFNWCIIEHGHRWPQTYNWKQRIYFDFTWLKFTIYNFYKTRITCLYWGIGSRSHRSKKPSTRLTDYIVNKVSLTLVMTSPSQSWGTVYPISDYYTCARFSESRCSHSLSLSISLSLSLSRATNLQRVNATWSLEESNAFRDRRLVNK